MTASAQAPDGNFILEADWALVCEDDEPKLLRDASIRVRADRIEEVREGRIRSTGPRVPAKGQVVLPGFISAHAHVSGGTPTRGIIEEGRSFMRPFELATSFDDETIDDLTAYNLAELLRSGCTTQLDMSISRRHVESYVRLARRWGVRAYPGNAIPGFDRLTALWAKDDRDDAILASAGEIAGRDRGVPPVRDRHQRRGRGPDPPDDRAARPGYEHGRDARGESLPSRRSSATASRSTSRG